MNPRLVGCMFASMLVGGACAGTAICAGWGLLAALGLYSGAGSATLVPLSFLMAGRPRVATRAAAKPGAAVA
ncbi:hypothetical protein [Amaricoccus solimangrovi]|uniref:Sulfite exporter TauE/SafE family protein n=1 Tax=Amaricoccus solimangrovi TaxID=2589815 RepID=A0A501WSQ4_9RHOB|nr:hypothetical protein [Amaricoccus solimangrovi]TPE52753.1 hypothetical protein FJM51_06160 [Amaricoccus solimangrovi]